MQTNVNALEKKAIKLALQENWDDAIKTNIELLDISPQDIKAKIRLGRAYLQTKDFTKASKLFKEVLEIDPINKIAKKNYELAKSKKTQTNVKVQNSRSLVKEPGTTTEAKATLEAPRITANTFSYGEKLELKILKSRINLVAEGKTIGHIENEDVTKSLQKVKDLEEVRVSAIFIRGEDKNIEILVKCSKAIFKSDVQDIKPYLKKGSIEEPEIEIDSFDDED